jgi:glycosyltransferase involved in cell wall biosynthesis
MRDSLSILHIVAPAPFGGLESVLRILAKGQTRAGHNVRVAVVLSPGDETNPFFRSLKSDGVAVSEIMVGDRNYVGERTAVRELCARQKPDVVHTHGYRPDVVDAGVARGRGIAVTSTCHGFIDAGFKGRIYQWVQRQALRRFDAVVAVSEPIARRLAEAGVARSRIHLVPNAFAAADVTLSKDAARRELDLPAERPIIGWVGRLSHEKGPDVAIDAFARMASAGASLVMIGAGRDEASLRARAHALGVGDQVLWRGVVPDAGRLFTAFDAFLLSSRTEGTPIALLEAMASMVPIVATRVGGVPNIVDGDSALLVESEDISAMGGALAQTFTDPSSARARATSARKVLDARFNVDEWLSRYESIYRSVLRMRSSPGSMGSAA